MGSASSCPAHDPPCETCSHLGFVAGLERREKNRDRNFMIVFVVALAAGTLLGFATAVRFF